MEFCKSTPRLLICLPTSPIHSLRISEVPAPSLPIILLYLFGSEINRLFELTTSIPSVCVSLIDSEIKPAFKLLKLK